MAFKGKAWMIFILYLLVSKFGKRKKRLKSILLVPKAAIWIVF